MAAIQTISWDAHSGSRLGRLWLGVFLIGIVSVGCVTRGTYEKLEAERNALANNTVVLQETLDTRSLEALELAAQLEATKDEAVGMQLAYDQLVGELESEVALGQIEVERVVNGIRLAVSDELLFNSGSVALNAVGGALIARVAQQIDPEAVIVSVEGHTDDIKISPNLARRFPTNWELAGARAAVVVRVLSEEGVDPTALRAVSRGPFDPRAPNDTLEGRARNRRTEIILRPIPPGL